MAQDTEARTAVFCRLSPKLRERLAEAARVAERSLSAEVAFRLRQSLNQAANEAAA